MSGKIFISYRREGTGWSARSLHQRLERDLALAQIFMDIDSIGLGSDFVKAIQATLPKCQVLIAVIGKNWVTSEDDCGNRRLDNTGDFVRMEIAEALKHKVHVIPFLVDGASMPKATELPEDLKPLSTLNALRVTEASFDGDCKRLTDAIKLILDASTSDNGQVPASSRTTKSVEIETRLSRRTEGPTKKIWLPRVAMLVVLLLVLTVGSIWFARVLLDRRDVPVTPRPTPATPSPTPATPSPAPATPRPTPATPRPTPMKEPTVTKETSSAAAKGYYYLGRNEHHDRHDTEAINDFTEAIKLDPDPVSRSYSYYERGNVYFDAQDWRNAIDDYTAAIKLNRDYPWAYKMRGNCYDKQGHKAEAKADFDTFDDLRRKGHN